MARRRKSPSPARRVVLAALLLLGFGLGVGAARYLVRLDRIVTQRFEGRVFHVPSRVYSAPSILYPGVDAERLDLRGTLLRLGYREAPRAPRDGGLPPGRFFREGRRLYVHLRPFEHPSRSEPGRNILLRLSRGGVIEEIRGLPQGRRIGAVLIEPEEVGAYYGPHREQRELVRLDHVPSYLIDAVLAVEDQRFETHPGIDLRRIAGAFLANLQAGAIREGASTLTQQLVKNFFLTPERTFERKLKEALMALIVEARYEKPRILELYLNEIYLGQRGATEIHGVGEAARFYFGKSARDLRIAESALLAAIIQSPNGLSPFRDPERALERRNLVLALMRRQGRLSEATYQAERAAPLQLATVTPERSEGRYFLDALRRQLPSTYDAGVLTREGLHIYSTLDVRLQHIAATALREGLARLEVSYPALRADDPGQRLQGCIVALRPQTGEVLALVGGRDYGSSQFNRCTQARRPAGSVFKPFVYIAGLEPSDGGAVITLASRLEDAPLHVETRTGTWEPQNYDRVFHGEVSVREAIERSYNVASARLALDVGIERVARLARRLGIESPLPRVPSLALGTADVSPVEIARAYATIANGGVRPEIRTFEDVVTGDGRTLERREILFERVLDSGTAYLATSLLRGVVQRGTAAGVRAAGLRGPLAGKTGTSDGERDAWFAGFTPQLVAVVWVGFDEPRSLGVTGSRAALPIWTRFMKEATGGSPRGAFLRPPSVVELEIDPESGALALASCPARRRELFVEGTEPEGFCPARFATRGRDEMGSDPERPRDGAGIFDLLLDIFQ